MLHAAENITAHGYAQVIVLGNVEKVKASAATLHVDLDGVEILDVMKDTNRASYVQALYEKRKAKGMTMEQAEQMLANGVFYGGMMVGKGAADGMVCGSICPTADTVRRRHLRRGAAGRQ